MQPVLYRDIDFRLQKIFSGAVPTDVSVKEDLNDIFQSIKNIILTSPRERPFLNSGGDLYSFKYEKIAPIELSILTQQIRASLNILEPRAIINSINIRQTTPGNLEVEVNFAPVYNPELARIRSIRV